MSTLADGYVEVDSNKIFERVQASVNCIKYHIIWEYANKINKMLDRNPYIRYGFLYLRKRPSTYKDMEERLLVYTWPLDESLKYNEQVERFYNYLDAAKLGPTVLVSVNYAWYFTDTFLSTKSIGKYADIKLTPE